MNLYAALIYWVIVLLWLGVLGTVCVAFLRNRDTFGTTRLLLSVVAIDTTRNLIENFYFGVYFGAQFGLFSADLIGVLGKPHLLIIPKIINVCAALVVLGLLLMRWLPMASRERANATQDLKSAELRLGLLVNGVKEYALCLIDPNGRINSWNVGAERMTGYRADEIIGQSITRFFTVEEQQAGKPMEALAIAAREGRHESRGWRVLRDGSRLWVSSIMNAIHNDAGQIVGFANVTKDITQSRLAEEALTRLAHFDQLTGLPNRVTFRRGLAARLAEVKEGGGAPVAIALFDLDGFKDINDTLGHSVGDKLLREVSRQLQASLRSGERIFRLGGDEFVMMMSEFNDPAHAMAIVDNVLRQLESRIEIGSHTLHIGASAGIAISGSDSLDSDEMIANADLALYQAKADGGRQCRLYHPAMRARAQARRTMEMELRRACAEHEFVLHYQPQIRLSDGAVVGVEALLRWQHPERGLLAPAAFIEVLSQSPVSLETGNWVLRSSCQAASDWIAMGLPPVRMGVNLFPSQLRGDHLLNEVLAALGHSRLPAHLLELEITENIAFGHDDKVLESLRELRATGVGLAFDDFGTGYASLSYLTRFPLTRIKIDRTFVQRIHEQPISENTAVVRSMIALGHNLGLEVIAEGVETLQQAQFLKSKRCDEVQGYLYAKPMSRAAFESFLRRHATNTSLVSAAS